MTADSCGMYKPLTELKRLSVDAGGRLPRGLQNRLWALRIQRLLVTDMASRASS
jgi:hypothetical protein